MRKKIKQFIASDTFYFIYLFAIMIGTVVALEWYNIGPVAYKWEYALISHYVDAYPELQDMVNIAIQDNIIRPHEYEDIYEKYTSLERNRIINELRNK